MNEVDKQALLGWLLETLKSAQGFALEQAPQMAREVVVTGRWLESFWMVLCACILVMGIKVINIGRRDKNYDKEWAYPVGVGTTIFGAFLTMIEMKDFILAWFTPRLYILEYVLGAMRGRCR